MSKSRLSPPPVVPDLLRVAHFKNRPDLGPKILFFSGGTALNGLSRTLKSYTHNSIHLVTPFDSGGSSAVLRTAFDMPAIGDIRSRLMALADETKRGAPEVYRLFSTRFDKDAPQSKLVTRLKRMAAAQDPLMVEIKNPMQRQIIRHLAVFLEAMPPQFDLRGASVGNLILAGGYLQSGRDVEPVIAHFSTLVSVLGQVLPVANVSCHLAAILDDGSHVVGQHALTGKEQAAISSPVKVLRYVKSIDDPVPVDISLHPSRQTLIESADMICYPPGSFYSSLVANLMPKGVGTAIAKNSRPKVYVPNLGFDPECLGMSLEGCIDTLITSLLQTCPSHASPADFLNFVLIDPVHRQQVSPTFQSRLKDMGVTVLETPLITAESQPYYDPDLLVTALLSFT